MQRRLLLTPGGPAWSKWGQAKVDIACQTSSLHYGVEDEETEPSRRFPMEIDRLSAREMLVKYLADSGNVRADVPMFNSVPYFWR
jgi:hypothetical protein